MLPWAHYSRPYKSMDSVILAQLHLTLSLGTSPIPKLPGLEASPIFLDVSSKGQVYPGFA